MDKRLTSDAVFCQRLLRFAGYDVGKIDGVVGRKTKEAICKWDADQQAGIDRYGKLDSRSEENLTTLVPTAQQAARKWFAEKVAPWMAKNGVVAKIICGTRTFAE